MASKPRGLGRRGARLWSEIATANELDPTQIVLLEECCRMADRLDELDSVIRGEGVLHLMRLRLNLGEAMADPAATITVDFAGALAEARQQQNVFKQLLVSLRLPDASTGKRPQHRGGARGAYEPSPEKAANVTSMVDRGKRRGA